MTSKAWNRKDLIGLQGLTALELTSLLDAAVPFKKSLLKPFKPSSGPLAGKFVAFLFSEPSTRTRSSFEIAARRLGAEVLGFAASTSSLLKGETVLDTIKNIEIMGVDYFIVRQECQDSLENAAPLTGASLINAGDGAREHPTQALLDLFTLRERKGRLDKLKVVIVGDIKHSRVARSNVYALLKLGAKVTVCGPERLLAPDLEGLGVTVSRDVDAALEGADAVNVLRLQLERQRENQLGSLAEYHRDYGITAARLKRAKPDCLVLHPGPINRGVEIDSDVADGPRSVILEQVANGVAVRMAVLSLIAKARRGNAA